MFVSVVLLGLLDSLLSVAKVTIIIWTRTSDIQGYDFPEILFYQLYNMLQVHTCVKHEFQEKIVWMTHFL